MRRPAGFSREASDQYRFMVPSWAEVRKLFAIAVADLDEHLRDVSVDGEKTLKPAHLVNAVLTWYLSRPRSEQIEIARQGRKACEWLRTQSEIPDFQRFDLEAIAQEWERLKSGPQPNLRIDGRDAAVHHAITNDNSKKRSESKSEPNIDESNRHDTTHGRVVGKKARIKRRGIA